MQDISQMVTDIISLIIIVIIAVVTIIRTPKFCMKIRQFCMRHISTIWIIVVAVVILIIVRITTR